MLEKWRKTQKYVRVYKDLNLGNRPQLLYLSIDSRQQPLVFFVKVQTSNKKYQTDQNFVISYISSQLNFFSKIRKKFDNLIDSAETSQSESDA